jgi:Domain of unknown function (DUF3883)
MTNLDIEKIGTDLVLEYERKNQRLPFKTKYSGCGWDICTANKNETRYIEIKTSTQKKLVGRWLEKAGHNHLKTNPEFWIYAVTEIKEDGTGKLNIYTASDITIEEDIKYVMKFNKS